MNEKALIQSVLQEQMPDFEVIRRRCLQTQGKQKGLPVYRIALTTAACCLLAFGIYFLNDLVLSPKSNQALLANQLKTETKLAMTESAAPRAEEPAVEKRRWEAKVEEKLDSFEAESKKEESLKKSDNVSPKSMIESKQEMAVQREPSGLKESARMEIVINQLENVTAADMDVKIIDRTDAAAREWGFDFVGRLKLPVDLEAIQFFEVYTPSDQKDTQYSVLHDYKILYQSNQQAKNKTKRQVEFTFSPNFRPLRDNFLTDESIQKSYIGDTEVVILGYKDIYLALFSWNEIHFEVESHGLTEDELVVLLRSAIKE